MILVTPCGENRIAFGTYPEDAGPMRRLLLATHGMTVAYYSDPLTVDVSAKAGGLVCGVSARAEES